MALAALVAYVAMAFLTAMLIGATSRRPYGPGGFLIAALVWPLGLPLLLIILLLEEGSDLGARLAKNPNQRAKDLDLGPPTRHS